MIEIETEKILLKEGECELDVISKLGENAKTSWFFLASSCIGNFRKTANYEQSYGGVIPKYYTFNWVATDEFPSTKIDIMMFTADWYDITCIEASDITFTTKVDTPKKIYFITN